jgi:FtsX-like permease family
VAADGWLIRRRMRARWPSTFALAALVALTSLIAFLAIGTAQRTRDAYPGFLNRSRVGDLLINPSLVSTDIDRAIRDLPGVEAVTTDSFLFVTSAGPSFTGDAKGFENFIQIRGSADGRYDAMDRPAISAGRLPTGQSEAFVSESVAKAARLHLGDRLPLAFGNVRDDVDVLATGNLTVAGTATVRIVGIGTMPDEVLPDGLYPRGRILISPDVVRRFTCPLVEVAPGASVEQIVDAVLPKGCARSFLYYSLQLRDGAAGVAAAEAAFVQRAAELNQALPHEEGAPGYFLIATTTEQQRAQVARSVQPTTSALAVLGVTAAVLTLVLAGLAIARDLRRQRGEIRQWWRLGLARAGRARVAAVSIVLGTTLGVALGLLGAWLLSPIGPVGSVRSVVPSPGRTVPSLVWVTAAALVLLLGLIAVVLTVGAVRRPVWDDAEPAEGGRLSRLWRSSTRPPVGEGFRAAFGSRRAVLLVASTALTATMFVAATTFASSLTGLLATPRSYGWPWDVTSLTNAGYGGMDVEAAKTALDGRADVADWATLGFSATETVAGHSVLSIVDISSSSSAFTVVRGRLPRGPGEVAVGALTADDLGLHIGDTVDLAGDTIDPHPVTVTGVVVLPALGPFAADRAGPGLGILLPQESIRPAALDQLATFVGIRLTPGAVADEVAGWLREGMTAWESTPGSTQQFAAPIRPPEIVNAGSVRSIPDLVGFLFAAATLTQLGIAVALSVRSRRRELGTLRALGFTRGQLHRSVGVQAVATMAAALAVSLPIGVVLGRVAWRAFADRLGVLTDPSTSARALLAAALAALVMAWVVSLPGQAVATGSQGPLRRE